MAIIPAQGSFTTPSERTAPKSLRPEVQHEMPVLDEQALLTERGMRQTFQNNTAVNMDRFTNNLSAIAGYPDGRIIKVTYFSLDAPLSSSRDHLVDILSTVKDNVHVSLSQIRNFEIRCPQELSFEYNEEDNKSGVTGKGIVFAGFEPKIHDGFMYELRNGKIGWFEVTSISRLALGQDTYHEIGFMLTKFLDVRLRDKLQKQSSSISYFDKTKFLVGNHAMLTSEGYIYQKDLTHLRAEIVQNYKDRFWSLDMNSFVRPDGVYDPYAVEYWNRKVRFVECGERPSQLFIAVKGYERTIWSILTGNPIRNLKNVCQHWGIDTLYQTFWSVNQTALLNKEYLYVTDEKAIKRYPTIDKRGDAILVDVSPVFHPQIEKSATDRQVAKDFERFRRNHGGIFPNAKCVPGTHYTTDAHWKPDECQGCGVRDCEYAQHRGDETHELLHVDPPYPILSNEELFQIWVKLNKYTKDHIYTQEEMSKFQGYLLWYRENHRGTLSRTELEEQWRKEGNIPADHVLTPEEDAALVEYIKSYRKDFLPVLTDREIEIIYRVKMGISFGEQLDQAQLMRLGLVTFRYREMHGRVPDDGYARPVYNLGSPVTYDEVEATGALMYDHAVIIEPLSLEEIDKLEAGIPISPVDPVIPSDRVPKLYKPQLRGYHFCPSKCYYKCGPSVRKVTVPESTKDTSSYVFSNEFYLGSTAMEPFEALVYAALNRKEVDIRQIVDAVSAYLDWDDETAFYRELVCLYLIDYGLHWLTFHS